MEPDLPCDSGVRQALLCESVYLDVLSLAGLAPHRVGIRQPAIVPIVGKLVLHLAGRLERQPDLDCLAMHTELAGNRAVQLPLAREGMNLCNPCLASGLPQLPALFSGSSGLSVGGD